MTGIPFITQVPAAFLPGGAHGNDIAQMILHAGIVVKLVLLVLLAFSVACWAIIFVKLRLLSRARRETESFMELFWENRDLKEIYRASGDLSYSPVAGLFSGGYAEFMRIRKIRSGREPENHGKSGAEDGEADSRQLTMDNLSRSLRKASIDQTNRLERGIGFLATTGNTAPFIGLFGTVWGIMQSFQGIGLKGSASLAVVAPGISEALVATAAGLAAAIPAVVAFNHFTHKISAIGAEMDIFAADFLSTVERQFFKKQAKTGDCRP